MKKRIILILALSMLLLTAVANAAEIEKVVLSDFDKSILTVSGKADETVTIVALKNGEELLPGEYGTTEDENMSIQTAVPEEGSFTVSFKFPVDTGDYNFYVSGNSTPYPFEFIDKDEILDFIDDLGKGEVAEEQIYAKLEYYAPCMGIDLSFVKNENAQKSIAKNLVVYKEEIKKLSDVEDFVEQTKYELEFLEKLSNTQTEASVHQQLTGYDKLAKINLTEYTDLSEYDKESVCFEYIGAQYTDIHMFRADFANSVTTAAQTPDPTPQVPQSGNPNRENSSPSVYVPSVPPTGTEKKEDLSGMRLFDEYDDLGNVSWAWDAILYLLDEKIMSGVGGNKFAPEETLKREQFAKIITVAFDFFESGNKAKFDDLKNDGWSEEYIASAQKSGIMNGVDDKNFGYGADISRQDICVTIYRAAKLAGYTFAEQKTEFEDFSEVADYAKEAVSYLAGADVISGMGDGKFAPRKSATRAEAAKIVYAVLGGLK